MVLEIRNANQYNLMRVLVDREEKARKEANRNRGIFSFLSKTYVYTLLAMFFLVEQDYCRGEYYCLKATLIGIEMVTLPLCILFSVGEAIFYWRGRC